MNSKQFFKQLGMLLYGIDGIYDEYGRKSKIASPNVLWVLYALNDDEKHSQKDICEGWSIPRTTINTIIKDLEQQQMVEMIPIPGKRREKYVRLTEKGKEYADYVLAKLYEKERMIFEKINDPEKFINNLEALFNNVKLIIEE